MPHTETGIIELFKLWLPFLVDPGKIAAFHWPAAVVSALITAGDAFVLARDAYLADKSATNKVAKDTAKKVLVALMRDFATKHIRNNDAMTEAQKAALGVFPRDTTKTSHPVPTSMPTTTALPTLNHYEHRIYAEAPGLGKAKKPADAYGVRYGWQVGGEMPVSGAALPRSLFRRRASFVVSHTGAEKGKTVYYATCYENGKGEPGPWSPVIAELIA
jgi:hypothetical protein